MHTLKEILTEPQTMYDGGVVGMVDGGTPEDQKKVLEARQKIEQIEVPEEPTPTGTAVVEGAKKLAKGAVKQAIKRIPVADLLYAKPAGKGSTIYNTPEEYAELLEMSKAEKSGYTKDLFHLTKVPEIKGDILRTGTTPDEVVYPDIGIHVTNKKGINFYTDLLKKRYLESNGSSLYEIEGIPVGSSLYEEANILPLLGKLDNTITIPDMGDFRTPSQSI